MQNIKYIIEALLLSADQPIPLAQLIQAFPEEAHIAAEQIMEAIVSLKHDYRDRAFEINESVSGFFLQTKAEYAPWIHRLHVEKPLRYSKAQLETLAVIAYRQPVTRADIEAVRGVAVSSAIMKTLMEREWIKIAGYRDVPGKPAMYVTTNDFLVYFNLSALSDLPKV